MLESKGWIEFHAAMNLLANTTGSLLIARRDLINALKSGRIQSAATKKVYHPETDEVMFEHDYLLDPLAWDMDHLLTQLFASAEAQDRLPPEQLKAAPPGSSVRPPEDARIWEQDFVEVFPAAGQVRLGQTAPNDHVIYKMNSSGNRDGKGGRPTKYDWEGAVIEMARVALLEEDCGREALTSAVQKWFAQKGDQEPADSSIRALVKRFHESVWPPKT